MHKTSKQLILATFTLVLIASSCSAGSSSPVPDAGGSSSSVPDEGGIDGSGGSAAAIAIGADVGSLPNDDSGMAQATEIFNDAGLGFNAAALEGGFGSDFGELDDSSRCLKVDAAAVGEILGMNLDHHPKPNDAPDQTRQPHLRCQLIDVDSGTVFPVVEFFLSPVLGLENPDPNGFGKKWDAGGAFDAFVTVDGLGDFAEWMAEQTNLPERSVLYVEAGGGSAMIIGQVRDGDDSRPMNGPPLIFALAEITSAF